MLKKEKKDKKEREKEKKEKKEKRERREKAKEGKREKGAGGGKKNREGKGGGSKQAATADRHQLYQQAVQAPKNDVSFFVKVFHLYRSRKPISLKEGMIT
jgi:ATP-dependent RNA helicase DBP3